MNSITHNNKKHDQIELFSQKRKTSARGGPPNRMNDLCYTDWMKFQKSFFRFSDLNSLVKECIEFFTKAVWPDGRQSRSLIISNKTVQIDHALALRIVDTIKLKNVQELILKLQTFESDKRLYDFIMIDFRQKIKSTHDLSHFLNDESDTFFSVMRKILLPDKYGCILVGLPKEKDIRFPAPWSIAQAARRHMKLRDEKIALVEDLGDIFYCIFLQSADDTRMGEPIAPSKFMCSETHKHIPLWLIPKPPPRKKNEILHPAKFPETLIGEFIELFTKPGANVLDPMVGTGSSVLAAIQRGRNGIGIDLEPEFTKIARQRITDWGQNGLFPDMVPIGKGIMFDGDATELSRIKELQGMRFEYAITSPPYWSMLSNPGSEGQRQRKDKGLRLVYSDNKRDIGNILNYDQFLDILQKVYNQVAIKLAKNGILTVIVKNIKRDHTVYALAWDLTARLCGKDGPFEYIGTTLWCQDDVGLKPFAVGIHWVSNTLHQYCLHYKKK